MTMHSTRRLVALTCFLLLFVGLGVTARAQGIYQGKITGAVASPDGALLPGATVEISSPGMVGGKRSATTSAKGTYVFLNLPVGKYTIVASMPGFKTIVRENIDVSADTAVTLNVALPVGEVAETVTVTAEGPVVDTKTSTIDSKIDSTMLEKLPTTRDAFLDLALTTPGMAPGSGAPTGATEFPTVPTPVVNA